MDHTEQQHINAAAFAAIADERHANEAAVERMVYDYLRADTSHRFVYGGPVNLCTTIAKVCKRLAEETGATDWLKAERLFSELEEGVDLPYRKPSRGWWEDQDEADDRAWSAQR